MEKTDALKTALEGHLETSKPGTAIHALLEGVLHVLSENAPAKPTEFVESDYAKSPDEK